MAHPLVVESSTLQPFSFYREGHVCRGIYLQKSIFVLVDEFNARERQKAYEYACQLSRHGSVIFAAGQYTYQIWADLRNATTPLALPTAGGERDLFNGRTSRVAA